MGSQDNSPLERLSQILNIPDLGGEDWDLMFADSERVDEFCDAYENAPLNADEKIALMELIVASYDCHLIGAAASALESRVSRLLEHDFDLHRQTIEYWECIEVVEPRSPLESLAINAKDSFRAGHDA